LGLGWWLSAALHRASKGGRGTWDHFHDVVRRLVNKRCQVAHQSMHYVKWIFQTCFNPNKFRPCQDPEMKRTGWPALPKRDKHLMTTSSATSHFGAAGFDLMLEWIIVKESTWFPLHKEVNKNGPRILHPVKPVSVSSSLASVAKVANETTRLEWKPPSEYHSAPERWVTMRSSHQWLQLSAKSLLDCLTDFMNGRDVASERPFCVVGITNQLRLVYRKG
jgi:hypothetical protein